MDVTNPIPSLGTSCFSAVSEVAFHLTQPLLPPQFPLLLDTCLNLAFSKKLFKDLNIHPHCGLHSLSNLFTINRAGAMFGGQIPPFLSLTMFGILSTEDQRFLPITNTKISDTCSVGGRAPLSHTGGLTDPSRGEGRRPGHSGLS